MSSYKHPPSKEPVGFFPPLSTPLPSLCLSFFFLNFCSHGLFTDVWPQEWTAQGPTCDGRRVLWVVYFLDGFLLFSSTDRRCPANAYFPCRMVFFFTFTKVLPPTPIVRFFFFSLCVFSDSSCWSTISSCRISTPSFFLCPIFRVPGDLYSQVLGLSFGCLRDYCPSVLTPLSPFFFLPLKCSPTMYVFLNLTGGLPFCPLFSPSQP